MRWAIEHNERQEDSKVYVSPKILHTSHIFLIGHYLRHLEIALLKISSIVKNMHNPDNHLTRKNKVPLEFILSDDTEYDINKFADVTYRLDKSRNQHIKDYIPSYGMY